MTTKSLICLAVLLASPLCAQQPPAPLTTATPTARCSPGILPAGRPANWAQPIMLEGVPNLHRIAEGVYRSAQPTAEGLRNLQNECGIRTVINFRQTRDDEDEAGGTNLKLLEVSMFTGAIKDKHVVKAMRMLSRKEDGPFLIHCTHGADRTGLMSAMYRVLFENWSPEDARNELVDGGYGFHSIWKNIPKYVLKADAAKLRAMIAAP